MVISKSVKSNYKIIKLKVEHLEQLCNKVWGYKIWAFVFIYWILLNIIYCTEEECNYTANQHMLIFYAQKSGAGWMDGWKGGW